MSLHSRTKTIIKPGYHLKPKYDLLGMRAHVKGDGKKASPVADLPLTSMIDMFTILVVFLLMNFSATGEIFFIQKNLKLPEATHAHPLISAPLITVTAQGITLETEKVGDNPLTLQESDQNLPQLAAALKKLRIIEETIHPNIPFKGNVNIQADEKTPLVYIKRVMQTCITEGWGGINFAVRSAEKE
jgi:biopolymer transport protein ExbD